MRIEEFEKLCKNTGLVLEALEDLGRKHKIDFREVIDLVGRYSEIMEIDKEVEVEFHDWGEVQREANRITENLVRLGYSGDDLLFVGDALRLAGNFERRKRWMKYWGRKSEKVVK